MEQWKWVSDFEGLYEVSNLGRVRGRRGCLKLCTQKNGYMFVTLYKNGKQHHSLVHRLVAQSFLSNPNMLPEVNHISEDKSDNTVENLEWCTHRYNHNYGTGHKRAAKKQGRKVIQMTTNGEVVKIHDSVRSAARSVNRGHKDIRNVCNGYRKTSCGYKWRFA